jgi:hypothetical protein
MNKTKMTLTVLCIAIIIFLVFFKEYKPAIIPVNPNATSTNYTNAITIKCDPTLWQHVYNPQRLQVIKPCMAVSGYIEKYRIEKDGDYHIQFRLDPQFSSLLNDKNMSAQNGDLVIEPICANPVVQADAQDACKGFSQSFRTPSSTSQHLVVIGSYVLDTHHGWNEIHPVSAILPIK